MTKFQESQFMFFVVYVQHKLRGIFNNKKAYVIYARYVLYYMFYVDSGSLHSLRFATLNVKKNAKLVILFCKTFFWD